MQSALELVEHFEARANAADPDASLKLKAKRHKRAIKKASEVLQMRRGFVGASGVSYCSDQALKQRVTQHSNNREYLAAKKMVGPGGKKRCLAELAEDAKKGRLAELYAYVKGMEYSAVRRGWRWIFLTLTAPPEYHCNPSDGQNSWDPDLSPLDSHEYISARWRLLYMRLKKARIDFCGLRCAEPQKDATTHHHVLIFAQEFDLLEIERQLFTLFARKSEKCDAQRQSRADIKRDTMPEGDERKAASAASYILKYIAYYVQSSGGFESPEVRTEKARADAWRGTWNIRSISSFGCPSLTVWRRLRRMSADDVEGDALLESAHAAVHHPSGQLFFALLGGVGRTQKFGLVATDDQKVAVKASKQQLLVERSAAADDVRARRQVAKEALRARYKGMQVFERKAARIELRDRFALELCCSIRELKAEHAARVDEIRAQPMLWRAVENRSTGARAYVPEPKWTPAPTTPEPFLSTSPCVRAAISKVEYRYIEFRPVAWTDLKNRRFNQVCKQAKARCRAIGIQKLSTGCSVNSPST